MYVIVSLGGMLQCKTIVAYVEQVSVIAIKDMCTTLQCLLIANQLCANASVYTVTAAQSVQP